MTKIASQGHLSIRRMRQELSLSLQSPHRRSGRIDRCDVEDFQRFEEEVPRGCLVCMFASEKSSATFARSSEKRRRITRRITKNRFVRKKQLSNYSNAQVADRFILCCSDPIYTSSRPAERTLFQEVVPRNVSNSCTVPGNVVFVSRSRG